MLIRFGWGLLTFATQDRHSGMDCLESRGHGGHPCDLDAGIPCRHECVREDALLAR